MKLQALRVLPSFDLAFSRFVDNALPILSPFFLHFLIFFKQLLVFQQLFFDVDKVFLDFEQVLHLSNDEVLDGRHTRLVFPIVVLERGDLFGILSGNDGILERKEVELADLVNVQRQNFGGHSLQKPSDIYVVTGCRTFRVDQELVVE